MGSAQRQFSQGIATAMPRVLFLAMLGASFVEARAALFTQPALALRTCCAAPSLVEFCRLARPRMGAEPAADEASTSRPATVAETPSADGEPPKPEPASGAASDLSALSFEERLSVLSKQSASSSPPAEQSASSPAPAAASAGQAPDLTGMSFEERLVVLSKQYENVVPVNPEERKRLEDLEPEREREADEQFWRPEFWKAVKSDLESLEWPTVKKVAQTLYVSQIAFLAVVALVLVSDAILESGVRSLLLGEKFSLSIETILKTKS